MEFVRSKEEDIPKVLDLLHRSIGGLNGLRTLTYWKWKHELNPFGPSDLLLAKEGEHIAGIRAFLNWRFSTGLKKFKSVRAVDTVVDPQFRKRGIFSALTRASVEQMISGEPCVVFNTPNQFSLPGYLKLGWTVSGRTPLLIRPVVFASRKSSRNKIVFPFEVPYGIESFLERWKKQFNTMAHTDYSEEYFRWRYGMVPGMTYYSCGESGSYWFVFRIIRRKFFSELRIVEWFVVDDTRPAAEGLREVIGCFRPQVVTILEDGNGVIRRQVPFGFVPVPRAGLTLALRKVNDDSLYAILDNPKQRYLSAGTLELF